MAALGPIDLTIVANSFKKLTSWKDFIRSFYCSRVVTYPQPITKLDLRTIWSLFEINFVGPRLWRPTLINCDQHDKYFEISTASRSIASRTKSTSMMPPTTSWSKNQSIPFESLSFSIDLWGVLWLRCIRVRKLAMDHHIICIWHHAAVSQYCLAFAAIYLLLQSTGPR